MCVNWQFDTSLLGIIVNLLHSIRICLLKACCLSLWQYMVFQSSLLSFQIHDFSYILFDGFVIILIKFLTWVLVAPTNVRGILKKSRMKPICSLTRLTIYSKHQCICTTEVIDRRIASLNNQLGGFLHENQNTFR
jgi:hypothetical protein